MSDSNHTITTLSISNLLNENNYIIPIYQRNYAWDKTEITQLIQDIIDKSDSEENSNYFIGTLIVDKKTKNNQIYYEVIDGQQRHTTLTLLNAYFERKNKTKTSNLFFDARPSVKKFIDSIYNNYTKKNEEENIDDSLTNIIRGVNIIDNFFATGNDLRNKKIDIEKLKIYFNQNVKIIRVNVPNDIDINHYFEIMNTRGVQLEKHQILKAAFIEKIKDDKLSRAFATIWDACSLMEKHIQFSFKKDLRESLFGSNLNEIPHNGVERIQTEINHNYNDNANSEDRTLLNILDRKTKIVSSDSDNNNDEPDAKYSSIIDFSNFLLHALNLYNEINHKNIEVTLDDKNLLKSFGYDSKSLPDSIDFVNFLLKTRTLFDKYIIKRQIDNSNDSKWKILNPSTNETDGLVNTFNEMDYKILMIQSMFHVSFPNNSYKSWLYNILQWITKYEFDNQKFFDFIFSEAKTAYQKRTIEKEWFNYGVGINNYIFNFTDFLLWKAYNDEVKNKTSFENMLFNRISKQRKHFSNFRFTQRSSIEHIHPQSKVFELNDESEEKRNIRLNNFGNLCLISRSTNSKYNDYNFNAKKEQFEKRTSTESLKQVIIFSYNSWNSEQINEHEKEIQELIYQNIF
ncbi:MAG: DUF262 domain-containing protein [Candidatus Methylacidiphilales bacterium]